MDTSAADELAEEKLDQLDDIVALFTVQDALAFWSSVATGAASRIAGIKDDIARGRGL